jgi:serine/threonine protein kinase
MSTLHKLRGTMIYCSPEVCKGEKYTDKSDIYSLAICLWELVNRCIKGFYEKPYAENKFESSIQIVVLTPKGLRPKLPEKCPVAVTELLNLCWENDSNVRPNCEQLLEKLESVEKDLQERPELYLESDLRRPSIESPELTLHR